MSNITFSSSAKYTFIGEIGRGGMGVVFLAQKECEGVADLLVLKTISSLSEEKFESLKNEARLAATLRHENIVRTYGLESIPIEKLPKGFIQDVLKTSDKPKENQTNREIGGEALSKMRDGYTYQNNKKVIRADANRYKAENKLYLIVMDYIDGFDLRDIMNKLLKKGLLIPLPLSAFIISRISRSLEYAHQVIIHRDLSPENILINKQGVAKLTDFGIAVAVDSSRMDFAGKLQYMSPEQLHMTGVGATSDIFALGLIAYQMATGISLLLPKPGLNFKEQLSYTKMLMKMPFIPPHKVCTDVPVEYSRIIMKMLAKDKKERYANMGEVSNDLERKYLYAKGFGPTNNSFQAYLEIIKNNFTDYSQDQLKKLSFLSDDKKRIHLKRSISNKIFTSKAIALAKDRGHASLLKQLSRTEVKV